MSASPLLWLAGAVASATQECDVAVTLTGVPGNAEGPFFPVDLGILSIFFLSLQSVSSGRLLNYKHLSLLLYMTRFASKSSCVTSGPFPRRLERCHLSTYVKPHMLEMQTLKHALGGCVGVQYP